MKNVFYLSFFFIFSTLFYWSSRRVAAIFGHELDLEVYINVLQKVNNIRYVFDRVHYLTGFFSNSTISFVILETFAFLNDTIYTEVSVID